MITMPRPLSLTAIELDVLARTLYGECRGEILESKLAHAWVIRNRVVADLGEDNQPDWWGEGVIDVCQKRRQFSCWNRDDPNWLGLHAVDYGDDAMQDCIYAALMVWRGYVRDPTWGARHYHAEEASPPWAEGHKPVCTIGRTVFFNTVK